MTYRPPHVLTSVTRIADLDRHPYTVARLPRSQWDAADYVAGRVTGHAGPLYHFELTTGRMMEVMEGAVAIGALGTRAATLEATGDWEAIPESGAMHALTSAGLFGRMTSRAPWLSNLMTLDYEGHVMRDGRKLTMPACVQPITAPAFAMPVVLLIGTSMSAGKTTTGRLIVRECTRAGLRVAAAKLTGAGRYRDVLAFKDAGADEIVDFVDAGLPSTIVPREVFDDALQHMLARVTQTGADLLVAEAGASPLEPYNGAAAVEAFGNVPRCTVLCASDPYAVLGVQQAFGVTPDLVTGPTANTQAGIELVRRLTGLDAINLFAPDAAAHLMTVVRRALHL